MLADYLAAITVASIQDLDRCLSSFRASVAGMGVHVGVNGTCATCSEAWPCGHERLEQLTSEAAHCARAVLDVVGAPDHAGYASDFRRQLVQLAFKCDGHNRDKLRMGFPIVVEVVEQWERDPAAVEAMARASDGQDAADGEG